MGWSGAMFRPFYRTWINEHTPPPHIPPPDLAGSISVPVCAASMQNNLESFYITTFEAQWLVSCSPKVYVCLRDVIGAVDTHPGY